MPMVWGGNHHCINVFSPQDFFVVLISSETLVITAFAIFSGIGVIFFQKRLEIIELEHINICACNDVGFFLEAILQATGLFACADKSKIDHVTGGSKAGSAYHKPWYNGKCQCSACGLLDKISALMIAHK